VVAVLFNAGAHVPVIPLSDVVGKAVKTAPEQIGATGLNVGIVSDDIIISVVVLVVAHCPASGTNVYAVDPTNDVLIVAGLQVPVILLFDTTGNIGGVAFKHNAPMTVKTGVISVATGTLSVAVAAHCPAFGVNV